MTEALVDRVLPLAVFLTAALWLARLAEAHGLADRVAAATGRLSGGRAPVAYGLLCALTVVLTATVSLDGAVVVVVPVALALAAGERSLRRPLLLGPIAVANASSLATPQGNPANVILMGALDIGPAEMIERLALPAAAATVLVALLIAYAERDRLAAGRVAVAGSQARGGRGPVVAAAGLATAGLAGALGPWVGVGPLWGIAAVAVATAGVALIAGVDMPAPSVPVRVCLEVGVLTAAMAWLVSHTGLPDPGPLPVGGLAAVALGAAVLATLVGNLPATVACASLLVHAPLAGMATLAGLAVGALGSPRGSVATMIALQRAGPSGAAEARRRWLSTVTPVAVAGTLVAVVALAATT